MEVLVQTHNLTKQYGQHKVVSNVNLSVKKGEIYGLIRRNGAGKTTVLKLISRLAKPTEGDIYLSGHSHGTIYAQDRVGILIENPEIYPNMNAKDNVKLKCLAMGISGKNYITELLDDVGLSVVTSVVCALYLFAYSICTIAAGAVFWGNTFITFSFPAIIKLLIVQFLLHWSFCCLLLLFYMLTNSTTATMVIGLLISFKILNIIYALVERFTHFNIAQYMLDSNVFQIGMESTKPIYTRAAIVGLIFLLAEIVLLCVVMRKKDIK